MKHIQPTIGSPNLCGQKNRTRKDRRDKTPCLACLEALRDIERRLNKLGITLKVNDAMKSDEALLYDSKTKSAVKIVHLGVRTRQ